MESGFGVEKVMIMKKSLALGFLLVFVFAVPSWAIPYEDSGFSYDGLWIDGMEANATQGFIGDGTWVGGIDGSLDATWSWNILWNETSGLWSADAGVYTGTTNGGIRHWIFGLSKDIIETRWFQIVTSRNDVPSVPEPAYMLLFGTGLVGLAAVGIRIKR